MGRRLRTAVAVHTKAGTVWLSAGQCPPEGVAELVTAPHAWEDDGRLLPEEPVEEAGPTEPARGSTKAVWAEYAHAIGVEIDDSMSRAQIIAAVKAH